MEEKPRKVIQICSTPETFESQFTLFALCDDGAIFQSISGGEWQGIPNVPEKNTPEEMPLELYRHAETGGIYEVICNAYDESTKELMVVYRNVENGVPWVKPAKEFNDGRFT